MNSEPLSAAPSANGPTAWLCFFVRLYWFMAGNFILFILAVKIFYEGRASGFDAAFWAVAAGMIAARFVDIRFLHGQTADGRPATMRVWPVYSAKLAACCLAAWSLARLLA
jgi:hypothetical protein